MVQAISPADIAIQKVANFPDFVMEEWNKMIAMKFTANRARIGQNEMIEALLPHTQHGNRQEVFDNHWLDVEEVYRANGWDVEYDKPAYNESYEATFTFTPKG